MKWICSQMGAREHYAIARVLARGAALDTLYTDFWAGSLLRGGCTLFNARHLATRYHRDLEGARVESFNGATVMQTLLRMAFQESMYGHFLSLGKRFGTSVAASLERRKDVNWPDTVFFGYDTGFLEAASVVKANGGKVVVCQMDPSRVEAEIVEAEEKRWPTWVRNEIRVPESYFQRRESEWQIADRVLANSEWTRQALRKQGVPEGKISVVPLAYEARPTKRHIPLGSAQRLRVLFLGQVVLRKGIQYLLSAARDLVGEQVQFEIVGPVDISENALRAAPANVKFHGSVSRDRASEFYNAADVFVLPTLSDGFALTQIEAMAHGVPVIATDRCGTVVSDGVDGFLIPAYDSDAITSALRSILANRGRLQAMSAAAALKAEQFGLSRLGTHIRRIEESFQTP